MYIGVDNKDGKEYIVKEMRPRLVWSDETYQRLVARAQAHRRDINDEICFIVEDWLEDDAAHDAWQNEMEEMPGPKKLLYTGIDTTEE